jgi:hypothetical protein
LDVNRVSYVGSWLKEEVQWKARKEDGVGKGFVQDVVGETSWEKLE